MVLYNFWYFWGQHRCWTETSIIDNDLFVSCFALPSTILLPTAHIPLFQRTCLLLKILTSGSCPLVCSYVIGPSGGRCLCIWGLKENTSGVYFLLLQASCVKRSETQRYRTGDINYISTLLRFVSELDLNKKKDFTNSCFQNSAPVVCTHLFYKRLSHCQVHTTAFFTEEIA